MIVNERVLSILQPAIAARDAGDYQVCVQLASESVVEVVDIFGKYSQEAAYVLYFLAQTAYDEYRKNKEAPLTMLRYASGNAQLASVVLEDYGNTENLLYLTVCCLLARIYIIDSDNYPLEGKKDCSEDMTRQQVLTLAYSLLSTVLKIGHSIFSQMKNAEEKEEVLRIVEIARGELVMLTKPPKQEKNRVIERHFFNEELGCWLRVYKNVETGEIFFNSEDVCNALGVPLEEGTRVAANMPDGLLALDEFDIIDEKS